MEFTLPLPQKKHVAPLTEHNWKNFYHRFRFYSKVQPQDIEVQDRKSESILLFLGGQAVIDVVKNLPIYNEEGDVAASVVLEMVSEICLPRFILLYERFKFFSCKQQSDECICRFLFKLSQLLELCEFEDDVDSHVADRIVRGASDGEFRASLRFADRDSLADIIQMCSTVTKCKNGRCCIDFGTYSNTFLSRKSKAASMSSEDIICEDSMQDAADAVSVKSTNSAAELLTQAAETESPTAKPLQPDFWQFEELLRNKSTAETHPESFNVNTRSQAALAEQENKELDSSTMRAKLCDEIMIKKEEFVHSSKKSQKELKSHNSFWDTVTFDDSDGEFDIKKSGKGSNNSDNDSLDDVPVTVFAPLQEKDKYSQFSQGLGSELKLGEGNSKLSDPVKSHGISRLKFAAKTGSPSPLLGVAVKSVVNSPPLTEISDFIPQSVSFTVNDAESDSELVAADHLVGVAVSEDDNEKISGTSTGYMDMSLPNQLSDSKEKRSSQQKDSFFDMYSGWMMTKPGIDRADQKHSSTLMDSKSTCQKNVSKLFEQLETRTKNTKESAKRRSPRRGQSKFLTPVCSKDDSESDEGSDKKDIGEEFVLRKGENQTVIEADPLLPEARDAIEKMEAAEDVQTFFSLFDKYKSSQDSQNRLTSDSGEFATHSQLASGKVKTLADRSLSSRMTCKFKSAEGTSFSSLYDQEACGKGDDSQSDDNSNESGNESNDKQESGRVARSSIPQKKTGSRKGKSPTKTVVDAQPFLSQFSDYSSLLSLSDQDTGDVCVAEDYDYSEIVKRSVDEIVHAHTGMGPAEDTDSFFAQYGSQKDSTDLSISKNPVGFDCPDVSKCSAISDKVELQNETLTVSRKRNIVRETTPPKIMKLAEKREIKTSEGAKKVTCLTLKL